MSNKPSRTISLEPDRVAAAQRIAKAFETDGGFSRFVDLAILASEGLADEGGVTQLEVMVAVKDGLIAHQEARLRALTIELQRHRDERALLALQLEEERVKARVIQDDRLATRVKKSGIQVATFAEGVAARQRLQQANLRALPLSEDGGGA